MALLSGSFTTTNGVSAVLSTGNEVEEITGVVSGTWNGATILFERAITPAALSWEPVAQFTANGRFTITSRPNDRFRVQARNCGGSTSLAYLLSDGDKVIVEMRDREGNVQLMRKQSGVEINGIPADRLRAADPAQKVTYFTDFLGDQLEDELMSGVGSGTGNAVALVAGSNGRVQIKTSSADAADAANASSIGLGALAFTANQGGVAMEARVQVDNVAGVMFFIGFTDTIPSTVELPIYLLGVDIDSTATDACGVVFDTDGTTAQWCHGGVKADVDTVPAYNGSAPVANTWYKVRVEVGADGSVQGFVDDQPIGDPVPNAVTATVSLVPIVVCCNRSAAARNLLVDYVLIQANR